MGRPRNQGMGKVQAISGEEDKKDNKTPPKARYKTACLMRLDI